MSLSSLRDAYLECPPSDQVGILTEMSPCFKNVLVICNSKSILSCHPWSSFLEQVASSATTSSHPTIHLRILSQVAACIALEYPKANVKALFKKILHQLLNPTDENEKDNIRRKASGFFIDNDNDASCEMEFILHFLSTCLESISIQLYMKEMDDYRSFLTMLTTTLNHVTVSVSICAMKCLAHLVLKDSIGVKIFSSANLQRLNTLCLNMITSDTPSSIALQVISVIGLLAPETEILSSMMSEKNFTLVFNAQLETISSSSKKHNPAVHVSLAWIYMLATMQNGLKRQILNIVLQEEHPFLSGLLQCCVTDHYPSAALACQLLSNLIASHKNVVAKLRVDCGIELRASTVSKSNDLPTLLTALQLEESSGGNATRKSLHDLLVCGRTDMKEMSGLNAEYVITTLRVTLLGQLCQERNIALFCLEHLEIEKWKSFVITEAKFREKLRMKELIWTSPMLSISILVRISHTYVFNG